MEHLGIRLRALSDHRPCGSPQTAPARLEGLARDLWLISLACTCSRPPACGVCERSHHSTVLSNPDRTSVLRKGRGSVHLAGQASASLPPRLFSRLLSCSPCRRGPLPVALCRASSIAPCVPLPSMAAGSRSSAWPWPSAASARSRPMCRRCRELRRTHVLRATHEMCLREAQAWEVRVLEYV